MASSVRLSVELELDAVLVEVGHFGRYQKRMYCAILAAIIFSGVYNAQYVFAAADVKYRCVVPECESSSSAQWQAGPWAEWALVEGSRCERRAPRAPPAPCEQGSFGEETQRCTAWVYETHDSIVAEFELACQDWKRALVGTVHSTGVLTALIYIGALSDRFGRRIAFILTATSAAAVGLARSFVNSYYPYLALEYLEASVDAGLYTTAFLLAFEMTGAQKRVLFGGIISGVFAIGQVLLAVAAWAFPYWRTLTRILYAPSFLFMFYSFFLDESFRWLVANKRQKEAIQVLNKVATVNKRSLSEETAKKLLTMQTEEALKTQVEQKSALRQLIHSRILMTRLGICFYCWMAVAFVYYGVSINSVSLSGNMYLNYGLMSLVEIPGYVVSVLCLDRIGRKRTIMAGFLVCGFGLLGLPLIRSEKSLASVGQLTLAMAGKLAISTVFSATYVFTSELFPTPLRHRALGSCSLVGRIGQITAMLTPLLLSTLPWLPYVLFGGVAALAASLLAQVPETLHQPLPETVAQAERLHTHPAPPPPPPHPPAAEGSDTPR